MTADCNHCLDRERARRDWAALKREQRRVHRLSKRRPAHDREDRPEAARTGGRDCP